MGEKFNYTEVDEGVCECGDWEHQHDEKGCKLRERCTPTPCKKYRFIRVEKRRIYDFKSVDSTNSTP